MIERGGIERPFYTADLTIDDVETWTPVLDIGYGGITVQLHHFNTVVRLFENESANHVEFRHDKVLKGLKMAQELMDMMIEYDFSYKWDRRVDEHTMDWLIALDTAHLEQELDEVQGES